MLSENVSEHKCIFGPVPSRRLGVSLGIDLVPPKTCTLDCVFCECGHTTHLTTECRSFVGIEKVLNEIDDYLRDQPAIDYITFSGVGEPTLSSDVGRVSGYIRHTYPGYKLALLTNSTLLFKEEVLKQLSAFDVILPSLNAVDEETFRTICRPHPGIDLKNVLSGLNRLKDSFRGEIWLEVFLVKGVNEASVMSDLFRKTLLELNPDKLQLNTLDRPGTENWVEAVSHEFLKTLVERLKPLNAEIVSKTKAVTASHARISGLKEIIISTLERRPCTIEDVMESTGIGFVEAKKLLYILSENGQIEEVPRERGVFYRVVR